MSLDYSHNAVALARVKGRLRNYQVKAVAQAIREKVCIFDMYMGLGKTVCALTALFALSPKKVLILCGRNAQGAWIHNVAEWFPEYAIPEEFVIIKAGNGFGPSVRGALWARDAMFYITTKETFINDQDIIQKLRLKFDAYIYDEAHRIPGHTTKTYKALEQLLRDVPIKFMVTGTWIKRHAGRGWRQLHMLNRRVFSSYWAFVNRYCIVIDGAFGKEIVGPKNTEEWRLKISPFVFRYHETNGNIPKSARKFMWVDMTKEQKKIYDDLSKNMLSLLESGELIVSKVSITTFMKHKQLLNCPKILSPSLGLGAAFEGLLALLEEADIEDEPEEHHFVLFSFFRASLDIFKTELEARGYKTWLFVGGTDAETVTRQATEFRAHKGKKSVALCTIDFAESFNLGTAERSHFIGTHYDVDPMEQAEARLARADSDLTKTIVHRYWLYNNTLDEDAVDTLDSRKRHVKRLFREMDDVKRLLMAGQYVNPVIGQNKGSS